MDAHTGIYRELAVLVTQHFFGLETLQQTTTDEGEQDAFTQDRLCLGHAIRIDAACRVEDNTRSDRLGTRSAGHRLKHPVNRARMELHMPFEAGAEAVDEGDCADVQGSRVCMGRTGAAHLQGFLGYPQGDSQHHVQHCPIGDALTSGGTFAISGAVRPMQTTFSAIVARRRWCTVGWRRLENGAQHVHTV